jgi:hypothetical protein
MLKESAGWSVVDEKLPVLRCAYDFGPGEAFSVAVAGADGLIVVSPPANPSERTFAELEARGKVTALVASNAFHTMGIAPFKARFPDAKVFAPAQSIARVEKKSKTAGIKPLSASRDVAGANVDLLDIPHYKTGEVLVRARSGSNVLWYVTDVLMNVPEVPPGIAGMIFKWTGSMPGLRRNNVAPVFMMKDKRSVWRWLHEEAEKEPPSVLVPAHGEILRMGVPGKELIDVLRA